LIGPAPLWAPSLRQHLEYGASPPFTCTRHTHPNNPCLGSTCLPRGARKRLSLFAMEASPDRALDSRNFGWSDPCRRECDHSAHPTRPLFAVQWSTPALHQATPPSIIAMVSPDTGFSSRHIIDFSNLYHIWSGWASSAGTAALEPRVMACTCMVFKAHRHAMDQHIWSHQPLVSLRAENLSACTASVSYHGWQRNRPIRYRAHARGLVPRLRCTWR